ncbi:MULTISPECIES: (S)-benzoin forming benzil reductase [Bacillus]|uniref:(S)-benzoin forming benzil reductase n=1 Tax=Bacillus glycinifermentans TaxID=1664069 RepID=A0AAJ4D3R1_9BACI|nr:MULTISPECIES: (S)-benzoin forming benzil reductase [Bacillus]KKB72894.1 short-chain dehydrogenase [Bacillus sp. TH008]MBU8785329.1 (S)-benzoin forming benzil reductase [Bacillus glycinifermentans]MDU0072777.1 (S)-benzoin forming benzil reductase [Bacillus sp. IG6]MED8020571.1 (S)-benzoin forming benzil reductase [Bacillus glycinifermentans]NUJ19089.1 (S)-benzoin forming benzil reductase [Bacillus glycinifermentans]
MHLSIVTGASKGLGEAIVKGLLEKGHLVHAVSRSKSGIRHDRLSQHEVDLTQLAEAEMWFARFTDAVQPADVDSITLINNAGMVTPIKRAGEAGREELRRHYDLNLLAPVILSQLFTKWLESFQGNKTIVNISSGAAKNPYKGWSAYCSSKAGLDMFTKTFGFEQEDEDFPVKMISFSPGVMDTGMQEVIRSSSKKDFYEIERFKAYQTEGKLRSTSFVAGILLDLLETEFENGRVYDIKEFL